MPRKTTKPRKAGNGRAVADPRSAADARKPLTREPLRTPRAQTRGGKPPRFPGRTGGR